MTTDVVVRTDGVARAFGRGSTAIVAIHGVTCAIRRGQQIALSGASGSGKTTLLHLLAGLDRPTTGTIEWPCIGDARRLRPGPIAVVFQQPSLLPSLDVVENVALPLLLQGTDQRAANEAARAALIRLDLRGLERKLPEELSGGQAQRVAVARALAGRPCFILADEPTGQLDRTNATLVIDALVDTAADVGAALIVNTHDRLVAARLTDHWFIHDGQLDCRVRAATVAC